MKFKFQNSLKEIGIWSLGSDFIVLNSTIMSRIFILSSLVKLYNFVQRTFTLWNSLSYARKKTQVWHMYYTVYKLLYHSWNINTIILLIYLAYLAPHFCTYGWCDQLWMSTISFADVCHFKNVIELSDFITLYIIFL